MQELRAAPGVPHAALADVGVASGLIRSAKHGQWRGGVDVFGLLVVERLGGATSLASRIDVVSWIPPDPGRRRLRGGHVPEQVARVVAAACGRPAQATLVRRRSRQQRGLDEHERATNVRGMFELRARRRPTDALTVLLLDDVLTTGATLDEAVRMLQLQRHRVVPYAVVGVPRRIGRPAVRGRGMDGVKPFVQAAPSSGKPAPSAVFLLTEGASPADESSANR
jgi:predicted amidophosphoribosyltransferase